MHNVFVPNSTKPVTLVQVGDIVAIDQGPVKVTHVSLPYLTTLPVELDKSTDPKRVISITGKGVFWTEVEHESCFLYRDDNHIGTYSGSPKAFEAQLVTDEC